MITMTVRKSVNVHPETFRRLIADLDEFALISIRPMPRRRSRHLPSAMRLVRPLGIRLTREGEGVLQIARSVRADVRRHAELLPKSSAENWLDKSSSDRPRAISGVLR